MVPLQSIVDSAPVKVNSMNLKVMLAKIEARLYELIAQNDRFSENLDVVLEPGKEAKLIYT
eukprot:173388-Alexandrium_andersonii.AAC.1